jgi:Poly(R)-hydroxyalkanoic acid synthase subunit (PHA_synth_III_E)
MADKSGDSATKPLDEQFREAVTQWERNFDAFANQFMATETFTRGMNQAQDAQMAMRKMFQDFMGKQLEGANMPSREDLVRLAETVHGLDRRMARIEDLLSQLLSNAPPEVKRSGPPRTRTPPRPAGA